MPPPYLLPPPTDDPRRLAEQAQALLPHNPTGATTLLAEGARRALAAGEVRLAALLLHRRAALLLETGTSPVAELASAARLLEGYPAERALLLYDLGQALAGEEKRGHATLVLRQSEKLARQSEQVELAAAARDALGQLGAGAGSSPRGWVRAEGARLIHQVEGELLATLRDMGRLPFDPFEEAARARREQAVEEELATLKQQMGLP